MRLSFRLWVGALPFLLVLAAVSPTAACVGDCDANDEVTVDEVVTGVNIALGAIAIDVCERFDANGDNEVTVDEILRAVSAALDGCPEPGTPTPTTTTTTTSTPVDTPGITPTETPSPTVSTPSASATPTEEPSVAPTATSTPSAMATATASSTPAPSDTPVPSASPVANTPTATATRSPSLTPQPTASFTQTKTSTSTSTSTSTPTGTASPTPTFSATRTPTVTVTATHTPTVTALPTSTRTPTASPAVSATPSATVTRTATATSTPTATPDPAFARRAAGTVVNSLDTFLALPSFLATLGSIPAFGIDTDGVAFPIQCPGGGTFTYSCGRQPPGPPEFFLTFSSCILEGSSGRTLTSDGSIAATGVAGQTCMTAGENLSVSVTALSLVSAGDTATTTVAIEDLIGNLTVTAEDPSCADTIASQLSGTVTTTTHAGEAMTSATVELASTSFDASFAACDASGTPTDYTLTVDGGVTFLVGDGTFATDFDTYGLDVTVGETSTQVTLAGSLGSGCLGGTATFATLAPLQRGTDAECPSSGVVAVTAASDNDRLTYSGGTVELDIGADSSVEETWPTCRAPQLYVCPE